MPLNDVEIRNAKPGIKPVRLFDSGGLYLEVAPSGGKYWRWKYRFAGKEKRLAFGVYPEVPLAGRKEKSGTWIDGARDKRDRARRLLAEGIDPGQQRQEARLAAVERATNNFEGVAREWFAKKEPSWATNHSSKIIRLLERDVFPFIGHRAVAELKPKELLSVLRRIEDRGAVETAHRALSNCSQIMRYAVATGRAERDIVADLRGALPPPQVTHLAAVTDPKAVGALLRQIDAYEGTPIVRAALQFAALVFVRPGELRTAKWADFDFEKAEWRFIASKTDTPHIVPLSKQALAILGELRPLTQFSEYVFPGGRSLRRPMSNNALVAAFRRMGIGGDEMTAHGFRAMARTLLDEVLGERVELIEHQLAHVVKDPLGRAYNRTQHLPDRRKMMQRWADYLEVLKKSDGKLAGIR